MDIDPIKGMAPEVGADIPSAPVFIEIEGEVLQLLAERALFWPSRSILMVADVHLGKAASFRHAGIAIPGGTGAATLGRLDRALAVSGAQTLIVLGDLIHAKTSHTPALAMLVHRWREQHPALRWHLLAGNHDKRAGLPEGWGLEPIDEGARFGPFVLQHHPYPSVDGYVLSGHLHPAVRLTGRGRQRARLPCFWFGSKVGVLPAFGEFTGLFDVQPAPGDRVFVIGQGAVIRVTDHAK